MNRKLGINNSLRATIAIILDSVNVSTLPSRNDNAIVDVNHQHSYRIRYWLLIIYCSFASIHRLSQVEIFLCSLSNLKPV